MCRREISGIVSSDAYLLTRIFRHRIASLHGTPNGVRGRDCRLDGWQNYGKTRDNGVTMASMRIPT
jgi:hypothetical protein